MHSSVLPGPPRELRPFVDLVNQVFEIEKKVSALTESNSIHRNVRRMKEWFEHELPWPSSGQPVVLNLTYSDPTGESYNETRTDCDASIAGAGSDNLVIKEVIKPIIWYSVNGGPKTIIQQAVVVVESQSPAALEALPTSNDPEVTTPSQDTTAADIDVTNTPIQ